MSLSRRGFLAALGLALPAATLLPGDAEAAETAARNARRKTAAQAPVAKKKAHAVASAKTRKASQANVAHRPARRRRRQRTAA